jgi:hypothetical protein
MILTTICNFSAATTASDIPTDWAREAVINAINNNILKVENGYVRPEEMLTREEMAYGIVNVFGANKQADMSNFIDVVKCVLKYICDSTLTADKLFSCIKYVPYNHIRVYPPPRLSQERQDAHRAGLSQKRLGDRNSACISPRRSYRSARGSNCRG